MSGSHDYMLKVIARSMDDFSDLTMRTILRWPGVQNVASTFVMEEIKSSPELPL
jgi:Lrp/AsnC family leucine-responsive transcriptional regulator